MKVICSICGEEFELGDNANCIRTICQDCEDDWIDK